jgi:hypothetical protein
MQWVRDLQNKHTSALTASRDKANLHEVGFQQVLTSADVLCIHKGEPARGLHLVHHRQQLTDLLHLVAPLALALFMLMAPVVLALHSQLGIRQSAGTDRA